MTSLKIDKVSETLGVGWKNPYCGNIDTKSEVENICEFYLGDGSVVLIIRKDDPSSVRLRVEIKGGYHSYINFPQITKVVYIPKYKKVRFESYTKGYFSILEVMGRGQFDLRLNIGEKDYSKTVWAANPEVDN